MIELLHAPLSLDVLNFQTDENLNIVNNFHGKIKHSNKNL